MTDKQIIIDGVDVSGCEWIREVGLDSEYICTCNSPNKTSGYCKHNPNCYYKQLKRKEQELNDYKKQFKADSKEMEDYQNEIARHLESIEYWQHQAEAKEQECKNNKTAYQIELDIYNQECLNLQEELKAKEQECEELKEERDTWHYQWEKRYEICESLSDDIDKLCEQLDQLKAENEELKEEIAKARMEICNQCGEKDDYNIPCKQIRDLDYGLQLEIEENDKLKQTLAEIKEIAYELTNEEYTDFIEGKQKQILQKISECEGIND